MNQGGEHQNTQNKTVPRTFFTGILVDLWHINVFNFPKLVTKEDGRYGHVHKVLGLLCLFHYIYRLIRLLRFGSMGFDGSNFTLVCIVLHMVLSGSSMIFHISPTRIRGAPMIYPEFRLHSILFAYRSLIVMLLQWLSLRYETTVPLYLRGVVIIGTMILADWVTRLHKDQGTTMRAMPFPEYTSRWFQDQLNLFYSISQIFATANCLFANRFDEVFAVVFPIQIAALLMTMVRKSIISSAAWHNFYALSLLSNYVVGPWLERANPISSIHGGFFFPCAFTVMFLRFVVNSNKYLIWGAVVVVQIFAMVLWNKYSLVFIA